MLAATGGAAGEVDADFVLVPAAGGLELIHQCDHAVLGLGDGEVAEFDAGAGDAALAEVGGVVHELVRVEVGLEGGDVGLGDVDEEEVLLVGEADGIEAGGAVFGGEAATTSSLPARMRPPGKLMPAQKRPGCFWAWMPR
jgi:hypothetical protein